MFTNVISQYRDNENSRNYTESQGRGLVFLVGEVNLKTRATRGFKKYIYFMQILAFWHFLLTKIDVFFANVEF